MSYIDLEHASPEELITLFVIQCRGAGGLFLPYSDHQIVAEWLQAAGDADELLVVLSEALPDYFNGGAKKSLAGVRKIVHLRLADRRARRSCYDESGR